MKRFTWLIFLIPFMSLLSSCSPIYKTEYNYIPPASMMGRMCISQCLQNRSMCDQMCQMRNESCRRDAERDAFYQYEYYKNEQIRLGKKVKKDISYFDRSLSCRTSCDCEEPFNSCYAACGGQILSRQVCVAFCDKQ